MGWDVWDGISGFNRGCPFADASYIRRGRMTQQWVDNPQKHENSPTGDILGIIRRVFWVIVHKPLSH